MDHLHLLLSVQSCIRRHNRERALDVKPSPFSRLSISDRQEATRERKKVRLLCGTVVQYVILSFSCALRELYIVIFVLIC